MPKSYSSKYFFDKLKKIRLIISQIKNYRSIEDMFFGKEKTMELNTVNHVQGREK